MTTLMLLGSGTPMLFQGQEFCASSPFFFFADHKAEIAGLVRKGRREFLEQWESFRSPEMSDFPDNPVDKRTFERSRLDQSERFRHAEAYALHKDLLRLRRTDPVLSRPGKLDGAVLGSDAFLLRVLADDPAEDRLLLVNLGRDLDLSPAPEPLLAAPEGMSWKAVFSTEHPRYGGSGTRETRAGEWWLPGHSALVFAPVPRAESNKLTGESRHD